MSITKLNESDSIKLLHQYQEAFRPFGAVRNIVIQDKLTGLPICAQKIMFHGKDFKSKDPTQALCLRAKNITIEHRSLESRGDEAKRRWHYEFNLRGEIVEDGKPFQILFKGHEMFGTYHIDELDLRHPETMDVDEEGEGVSEGEDGPSELSKGRKRPREDLGASSSKRSRGDVGKGEGADIEFLRKKRLFLENKNVDGLMGLYRAYVNDLPGDLITHVVLEFSSLRGKIKISKEIKKEFLQLITGRISSEIIKRKSTERLMSTERSLRLLRDLSRIAKEESISFYENSERKINVIIDVLKTRGDLSGKVVYDAIVFSCSASTLRMLAPLVVEKKHDFSMQQMMYILRKYGEIKYNKSKFFNEFVELFASDINYIIFLESVATPFIGDVEFWKSLIPTIYETAKADWLESTSAVNLIRIVGIFRDAKAKIEKPFNEKLTRCIKLKMDKYSIAIISYLFETYRILGMEDGSLCEVALPYIKHKMHESGSVIDLITILEAYARVELFEKEFVDKFSRLILSKKSILLSSEVKRILNSYYLLTKFDEESIRKILPIVDERAAAEFNFRDIAFFLTRIHIKDAISINFFNVLTPVILDKIDTFPPEYAYYVIQSFGSLKIKNEAIFKSFAPIINEKKDEFFSDKEKNDLFVKRISAYYTELGFGELLTF
jgi:hypothetical protein